MNIHMKCSKCGHSWETKSRLVLVTCPSCGRKTKNVQSSEKTAEVE